MLTQVRLHNRLQTPLLLFFCTNTLYFKELFKHKILHTMTQQNIGTPRPINTKAAASSAMLGAGFGLLLIALFLSGVDQQNPAWPRFWMLRPLIIVPLAGGMGGLFAHLVLHLRHRSGPFTILAWPVAIIGFIVALFLGTVLGLDRTLWN